MTTETICPPTVAWITVTVRCKWCSWPNVRVKGAEGTIVAYTCSNRRCGIEQEFVIK